MVWVHKWYHLRSFGWWNQINQQIRRLEVGTSFRFCMYIMIFYPPHLILAISFWLFRYLIAFKNLLRAIENIGIVSVYGIKYFTTGKVTQENFIKYVEHDTLIWEYLNSSIHLAPYLNEKLQAIYSSNAYKFYRERYLFIYTVVDDSMHQKHACHSKITLITWYF